MSKKIIAVLNSEPTWGGQHQYARTLMECVVNADDVELMAICNNQYWRKWCRDQGIRVLDISWPVIREKDQVFHIKHPLCSRLYISYMTKMGMIIRKEKVDAVLCVIQGSFLPNLNVKVIAPVHDLMHRYESRFPEVTKEYELREQVLSSRARYAWCILTDSKLGKRQFEESYARYVKKGHTHIVSLPFVAGDSIVKCEEETIDVPIKYIFYPAQFWQHKNHINLIKAVELLVKEIPDIRLILVGAEKNNLGRIHQYILEHNLSRYILINGFISNGNLKYLYRHAVGMIMPSYFGPTNIPPLEAMALGCPVAVSNNYAMPEQVGKAGLLFDPDSPQEIADCIRRIWTDESLRQDMITRGYQRIRRWNQKAFAEKVCRIIKQI